MSTQSLLPADASGGSDAGKWRTRSRRSKDLISQRILGRIR